MDTVDDKVPFTKTEHSVRLKKLKEDLTRLFHAGHQAHRDLYSSSRSAEDAVRSFQAEQRERLAELAEKSVLDIRNITDEKSEAITTALEQLTGYLNMLSDRVLPEEEVMAAERFVDSYNESTVFEACNMHFEGSLDLAEALLSVSRLGLCNTNIDEIGTCNVSDNTMKKSYFAPFWCPAGCRLAAEHSWASLTTSSITENDFYETASALSVQISKGCFKGVSKLDEEKILNVQSHVNLVRYVAEFEASNHRTPCVIPDITLLADMKLVLIDHYHNSIQLFDDNFSQLDEKGCPYPMGLCSLNPNTVAVSLRRTSQLAVFSINDRKLHHKRNIRVRCESYLWQVAYKSQRLFVVCDENNIHVLDTNGKEYYVVRSGVSPECGYLRYFDVNSTDCHIYLSEKRGLRCINFTGKLQWLFTNDNFPEEERDKQGHTIEDVCYYEGTVLGTHWTLSKVFQISTEGQFLRNLIVDHLEHPRVMSLLGGRLVVTQFHPLMKAVKRRTLKVFELESVLNQ